MMCLVLKHAAGRLPISAQQRALRSRPLAQPLIAAVFCLTLQTGLAMDDEPVTRARALHQRFVSIDAHVDIPADFATASADPGQETDGKIDLPKMDRGGLTGAVFAVFVPQQKRTPESYAQAHADGLAKLQAIQRMAQLYPARIEIARTPGDVRRIHTAGKHVAVIGMLNGFPLGPRAENLDIYYEGGLRQLGLTHAGNNDLADSSRPQARHGDDGPEHGGLSKVGKGLIKRLNERGIIVDVSQLTPAAVTDAIQISAVPVIASHAAVMSIVQHPRNLSDDTMRLIADAGGVVHMVAFTAYLRPLPWDFNDKAARIRKQYDVDNDSDLAALEPADRARYDAQMRALIRRLPPASVSDLVDAIDYAVRLIGIDHVGIATDFNHGGGLLDWKDAGYTYNVTAALLRRGYSDGDIAKLWGENWLRVFQAATDYAALGSVAQSGHGR
jgi:membrane dipeptidase